MLKLSLREYKPDRAQVLLVSDHTGLFSGLRVRDVSPPAIWKLFNRRSRMFYRDPEAAATRGKALAIW